MGNFIDFLRWEDKKISNPLSIIENQISGIKANYQGKGKDMKQYETHINQFLLQNLNPSLPKEQNLTGAIEEIMQRLQVQVDPNLNVMRKGMKIKIGGKKMFTDRFIQLFGQMMQDLKDNNISSTIQDIATIKAQANNLAEAIKNYQNQTPGAKGYFVFTEEHMGLADLLSQYGTSEFLYGVGEAAEIAIALALQDVDKYAHDMVQKKVWEELSSGKKGTSPMINLQGMSSELQQSIAQQAGRQWVLDSAGSTLSLNRKTADKADIIIHPRGDGIESQLSASIKSYWQGASGTIHFAGAGANLLPILSDPMITDDFNAIYLGNLYHNQRDSNIEKLAQKVLILLSISGGLRQQFSADALIVLNRSALSVGSSKPVTIFSISELSEKILGASSEDYAKMDYVGSISRNKGVSRTQYFANLLNIKVTAEITNLQKMINGN